MRLKQQFNIIFGAFQKVFLKSLAFLSFWKFAIHVVFFFLSSLHIWLIDKYLTDLIVLLKGVFGFALNFDISDDLSLNDDFLDDWNLFYYLSCYENWNLNYFFYSFCS